MDINIMLKAISIIAKKHKIKEWSDPSFRKACKAVLKNIDDPAYDSNFTKKIKIGVKPKLKDKKWKS